MQSYSNSSVQYANNGFPDFENAENYENYSSEFESKKGFWSKKIDAANELLKPKSNFLRRQEARYLKGIKGEDLSNDEKRALGIIIAGAPSTKKQGSDNLGYVNPFVSLNNKELENKIRRVQQDNMFLKQEIEKLSAIVQQKQPLQNFRNNQIVNQTVNQNPSQNSSQNVNNPPVQNNFNKPSYFEKQAPKPAQNLYSNISENANQQPTQQVSTPKSSAPNKEPEKIPDVKESVNKWFHK